MHYTKTEPIRFPKLFLNMLYRSKMILPNIFTIPSDMYAVSSHLAIVIAIYYVKSCDLVRGFVLFITYLIINIDRK